MLEVKWRKEWTGKIFISVRLKRYNIHIHHICCWIFNPSDIRCICFECDGLPPSTLLHLFILQIFSAMLNIYLSYLSHFRGNNTLFQYPMYSCLYRTVIIIPPFKRFQYVTAVLKLNDNVILDLNDLRSSLLMFFDLHVIHGQGSISYTAYFNAYMQWVRNYSVISCDGVYVFDLFDIFFYEWNKCLLIRIIRYRN